MMLLFWWHRTIQQGPEAVSSALYVRLHHLVDIARPHFLRRVGAPGCDRDSQILSPAQFEDCKLHGCNGVGGHFSNILHKSWFSETHLRVSFTRLFLIGITNTVTVS